MKISVKDKSTGVWIIDGWGDKHIAYELGEFDGIWIHDCLATDAEHHTLDYFPPEIGTRVDMGAGVMLQVEPDYNEEHQCSVCKHWFVEGLYE